MTTRGARRADGRARRRGRGRDHRAGAGRRRRVPAAPRLPRRAAPAVRPPRRAAGVRRGDHRVRPPRHVVRRRPLRRGARPDDVRQGGHVRLPAARRRARRPAGARSRSRPTRPTCCATATPTRGTRRRARPGWPTWRSSSARALVERATAIGARLGAGLRALAADGAIADARGVGAVWAAGLRPDQDAVGGARPRCSSGGVITRAIGTDTLTFCPPLVITDEQIDRIVDALAAVSDGVVTRPRRRPAPPARRAISMRRPRRRAPGRRRRARCRSPPRGGRRQSAPPSCRTLVVVDVGREHRAGVVGHVLAELDGHVGELRLAARRGATAGGNASGWARHGQHHLERAPLPDLRRGRRRRTASARSSSLRQHGPVEVVLGVEDAVEDQTAHARASGRRRPSTCRRNRRAGTRPAADSTSWMRRAALGSLGVPGIDLMYTRVFTSRALPGCRRALVTGRRLRRRGANRARRGATHALSASSPAPWPA